MRAARSSFESSTCIDFPHAAMAPTVRFILPLRGVVGCTGSSFVVKNNTS
jgi:hypothetical protein